MILKLAALIGMYDKPAYNQLKKNASATATAVLFGREQASVQLEKQSTMTRTYWLPLSVVTDMSRMSIATRSQR